MMFREYFNLTPAWDKLLALMGVGSTGLSIAHLNTGLSTIVALCTIAMIVPRAMMNWDEREEKKAQRKRGRDAVAKAEGILHDIETD